MATRWSGLGARASWQTQPVGFTKGDDGRITSVTCVKCDADKKPIAGTEHRICLQTNSGRRTRTQVVARFPDDPTLVVYGPKADDVGCVTMCLAPGTWEVGPAGSEKALGSPAPYWTRIDVQGTRPGAVYVLLPPEWSWSPNTTKLLRF